LTATSGSRDAIAFWRWRILAGLTEVLTGTCEVQDVIRTTIVDGLSFMSAGSLPPNPTETARVGTDEPGARDGCS